MEKNAPSEDDLEWLKEHASKMTELTAEIQAHAQMFKMAQDTTTTIIKTIGEALIGTQRKQ